MIVNDFDVLRAGIGPDETNTPLIIDANAVLAFVVAAKWFEPIAWRYHQILQDACSVQHGQLSHRNRFDLNEALHPLSVEKQLSVFAGEGLDCHGRCYRVALVTSIAGKIWVRLELAACRTFLCSST